jgi:type IV pilus biogenesis protein CpaD/CtpE
VHPNYGCAYQNNVAAMVANPADLLRQRAELPPDANRRAGVIEAYRAGQQAEGVLGPQASRGASRIIPQSD